MDERISKCKRALKEMGIEEGQYCMSLAYARAMLAGYNLVDYKAPLPSHYVSKEAFDAKYTRECDCINKRCDAMKSFIDDIRQREEQIASLKEHPDPDRESIATFEQLLQEKKVELPAKANSHIIGMATSFMCLFELFEHEPIDVAEFYGKAAPLLEELVTLYASRAGQESLLRAPIDAQLSS